MTDEQSKLADVSRRFIQAVALMHKMEAENQAACAALRESQRQLRACHDFQDAVALAVAEMPDDDRISWQLRLRRAVDEILRAKQNAILN